MISYILFDLDNTLYPSSLGLDQDMLKRIREFTAGFLGISPEEAVERRKKRMGDYGTTLEWLMAEEQLTDVDAYYQAVHPEGEEEALKPDRELRTFLEKLPLPAAVLTNAPMEHADRVLKKLELEGLFTHIFDIRWNGLKGKPAEAAFTRALQVLNKEASEVLFIDDLPSYVEGFIRLGGNGILIDERDIHRNVPYPRIRKLTEIARFL